MPGADAAEVMAADMEAEATAVPAAAGATVEGATVEDTAAPVPAAGVVTASTRAGTTIEMSTPNRGDLGVVIDHDDDATRVIIALRDVHVAEDLPTIDAHTAFPRWDGTPVDYGLAVDALLSSKAAGGSPLR